MYIHAIVTLICLVSQHWILFFMNLPLTYINFKMLMRKEHKCHSFTYKDYVSGGKKERNERFLKYKSIFHAFMIVTLFFKMLYNATNAVFYFLRWTPIANHFGFDRIF
mmetsp:Transcript_14086/g.23926  ORF Transcript_14086/g.23926 Transcript_14086/m.23926 type:complete len:108 (+) Transcript_14086:161-484(+)